MTENAPDKIQSSVRNSMKVSTDDGDIYVMKEKELIVLIDEDMKKLNDVIKKLKSEDSAEESPANNPFVTNKYPMQSIGDIVTYGENRNSPIVEKQAINNAFTKPSNPSISVSQGQGQAGQGSHNPHPPVPQQSVSSVLYHEPIRLTYLLYTESEDKATWSLLSPPSTVWPRECWWVCGHLSKLVELESMYTQRDRITDALYSYANYLLAIRVPEYNPAVSFSYTYGYVGSVYEAIGHMTVPDVAEYSLAQAEAGKDGLIIK